MTTVAFVTYKSGGVAQRVGPLSMDSAQTAAKEYARRDTIQDILIEEWVCLRVIPVGKVA